MTIHNTKRPAFYRWTELETDPKLYLVAGNSGYSVLSEERLRAFLRHAAEAERPEVTEPSVKAMTAKAGI